MTPQPKDPGTDPRVTVGRHTYGVRPSTLVLHGPDDSIEIGAFCSIAAEVLIFGGGEHRLAVTTFPLMTKLVRPGLDDGEAATKGPTKIGNDVWIGRRAMILSGVTVGHGAVIGAGAVVASDVPPYAVVAGNPARILRTRFDEPTVARLLAAAWWEWDDETIIARAPSLVASDPELFLRGVGAPPHEDALLPHPAPPPDDARRGPGVDRYLNLLRDTLVGLLVSRPRSARPDEQGNVQFVDLTDRKRRIEGRDWPEQGETMVGVRRLDNVRDCVERVLASGTVGDFIEAGVWRGGTTIFMRGILAAHGVTDRRVWVADSFQGLAPPNPAEFPADEGDRHHLQSYLAVGEDEVRANFERHGLLDEQVCFLPGWFKQTLPKLGEQQFALVRLDADMYEPTSEALEWLYPRLSIGGFLIVDDYGALPACRQAVDEYRAAHGIAEALCPVDWTAVYWRKTRDATP